MAHSKSAKKRIKQDLKKSTRNSARISHISTVEKQVNVLIEENKKEETIAILKKFFSVVDKASKKGAIKKNTADRKKSRVTSRVNKAFA